MLMTNCKPDRFRPRSDARPPSNDLAFFRRIRHVNLLIFDFKFATKKNLVFELPNSGQTSNASFSENSHSTQNLGVFLITISFA